MKFGRLLLQLLEHMPVEYRDKFLSYKQLKKVINTILKDNSLPVAAFVEVPGEESGERASVEAITARDVEVVWPRVEEPAGKRARGDGGVSAVVAGTQEEEEEGEGDSVAVVVGTKRKAGGGGEGGDGGDDAGRGVFAAPVVQGEAGAARGGGDEKELSKEEEDFLHLLNVELEKFNQVFTEKEEDFVMRLQDLKQRLEVLRQQNGADVHQRDWNEDLMAIRTGLVTLHGEVVLMESYSTLNYTGLVKILKKHDKRTGAVLRLPFIRRVLLQPFFSTELLSQLVQECENLLSTFPSPPVEESIDVEPVDGAGDFQNEFIERSYPTGHAAGGILKSTVAALQTIQEMRKKSSTVSAQSLPPCNLNGNHERYGIVVDEGLLGSCGPKLSEHSKKQESESMACASCVARANSDLREPEKGDCGPKLSEHSKKPDSESMACASCVAGAISDLREPKG